MLKQIITAGAFFMSISACASAQDMPPPVAAPSDAQAVLITIEMTAKDPDAFKAHLLNVIPVTRQASGNQYSWSLQDPNNPAEFALVQGWDSVEQQEGYMGWRAERGDLDQFFGFLVGEPEVKVRVVFDR